jgi:DNA-binding XRE family transcriptional regulator
MPKTSGEIAGSRLLELRTRAGWTRSELAARAGCGRDWVRLLEVDGREPGLWMARRIARALGTVVDAIWPEGGA